LGDLARLTPSANDFAYLTCGGDELLHGTFISQTNKMTLSA
jgi:hypothetical protein